MVSARNWSTCYLLSTCQVRLAVAEGDGPDSHRTRMLRTECREAITYNANRLMLNVDISRH
jgi:hypothetical protein